VHPAALVGGALEGALERGDEAAVLVGDDQPHPGQAAPLEGGQEAAPEHLVLAVAHVQAQHLTPAVGGDAGGDDHGHRHHLGGGVAYVQVGRVQVDVREGGVVQPSGAKRGDDLVQAGADAGDLGLGDARVDTQRRDQVVDRPGGHAGHVGLHYHRVQRLVDAPARFEDQREERTSSYLLPLSVDGLIVVASVSLVELAGRIRHHEADQADPHPAPRVPETAVPSAGLVPISPGSFKPGAPS